MATEQQPRQPLRGRRIARTALGTLALVAVAGVALLGVTGVGPSWLPTWVPRSWVQVLPDRSALPAWLPVSWTEVRSQLGLANSTAPTPVPASELTDYEFKLLQTEMKQGNGVVIAVRLVHKPTGKPVPEAVVFARRIDMAPEGMETMTAPLELLPSDEPGTYGFKTNLMMEGGWQLSLAAKVQGQAGTVQSRLVLKALP